jgi:hypothetical protein
MRNRPVISTAKVRGLIKKNGINYVDATGRLYPSIHSGVSVWQLCDSIYFKVYGHGESARAQEILEKFTAVLAAEGLSVTDPSNSGSYQIVKVA